jgi:hypothetical protein
MENEVVPQSKYPNTEVVKEVVNLWSVSLRKEIWVVKSCSTVYDVNCIDEGNSWQVHAIKGRWKTHWSCSIVMEYDCSSEAIAKTHKNIKSSFVANNVYDFIIDNNLAYETKMIIGHIQQTYQ